MSGPLVVTTKDGTVWTRRGALRGGEPLYAPQAICQCPEFVMATLPELAEHGIVGSADALPMPVGSAQRSILDRARDAVRARISKDDLRLVLENVIGYASELEVERHSTNEALSDAAEQLRADRDRIAELERQLAGKDRTVDEDPIAYALTEKADVVAPRVQSLRDLLAGQRDAADAEAGERARRSVDAQFPKVAELLRGTGGRS